MSSRLGHPPTKEEASKIKPKNSKPDAKQKELTNATEPPPNDQQASKKYPDEKKIVQTAAQFKEPQQSLAQNAYRLGVLLACLVGCIYVVFTKIPLNFNLNIEKAGKSYASYCNGHGVELRDSSCVCDIGYAGSQCQEKYHFELVHKERSKVSTTSVLLVTDTFGSLNPYNELSSAYENIAVHLGSNSFQVSVLYVGEESGRFKEIANNYASKNIKVIQLSTSGLNYGPSPSTTMSVDVFQWMLAHPEFDIVHFQASSGAGYYTLLAQHQGLVSWNSKFVVGMDSTSIHTLMQINSGDDNFLSTDLESLKLEFMQEKSIEYADTVIAPSKPILDDIRALKWAFKESSAVVLPHMSSKPVKRSSAEKTVAKELVFIGSLNIINGLPLFCDAIDRLIENGIITNKHSLRVTFLGPTEYIREMTSAEYLETRSINWRNVEWEIISEPHTVKEVVAFMSKKTDGRVALLPRLYDDSVFLFQELVGNSIPMIASRLPSMEDAVEESSSTDAMFDVNDAKSLADKISNALSDGLMPLMPAAHEQESWSSVFQDLANAKIVPENGDLSQNGPLVTVVLVHRNRQNFLEQAIASLYEQTYKNFEVILVDDGSDDADTIRYLQELAWEWWENRGWKVLREPHRYLGAARNSGVKHAKGTYILFMDDDDYAKPHQIETLVRVAKRTHADVITAGHDLFDGESLPPGRRGLIERHVPLGAAKYVGMLENCFGDSNMMVLRSFFVDFGGFSEDFGVGFEDYEFLAKVVLRGHHLEVIPESLHWYRRHRNAMSFNTDRKANQIRFLRAYMAEQNSAPHRQRALLEYTKTKFFARDSASLSAYEAESLNSTMTGCGPSLLIDDFAGKPLSNKTNRLGLEADYYSMKDAAIVDNKLLLTPMNFDDSYYYSILSNGCLDATPFNALEIVVGAQTPVNSSFAVVLRSPNDCSDSNNNTNVELRSLRTTQYATFNGTQQVLRIQLSDFELDTCRLHGLVLEDFMPANNATTYVIESIRFYTECMPYPTQVYHVPTATGTPPTETTGFNGVVITNMAPPAANISSDLTFKFSGNGFQNFGVNLYCVVDGVKTVPAVVTSATTASCTSINLTELGSHTLTLSVNGTTLPYSRAFFIYPSDAAVTTCQAKGYLDAPIDVRVDGHNLIDTGHVVCVINGPDFPASIIIPAMNATNNYNPYGNAPPPPVDNSTDYIKPHQWSCLMNVTTGGLYDVRLSLDGGRTTVPGHVKTSVYDHPPNILGAGFDDSGATVIVSFDKDIRIVGHDIYDYNPDVACSSIFDQYNVVNVKLGNLDVTTCTINGNMLEIALSSDSSLKPGDQLQFTDKTIFSKFNPFSSEGWLVNNTFTVNGPAVIPVPVVVAYAPKVVGSCDNAYVSAVDSYNDGGRPLIFHWSTNSTNSNVTTALSSANNTGYVQFASNGLPSNAIYTITVVAENFLGGVSQPKTLSFFKSANPVPQVQILGPAVQTVLITEDYFLNIETTKSSCAYDNSKLIYKWSFVAGSPTFNITNARAAAATLYIPSRSLANNVYTLMVEVSTAAFPNYKGYDTVVIQGRAPAPSFAIGNGDVTVGVSSNLNIYSYLYDPLGDSASPVVNWACSILNGNSLLPCTIAGGGVMDPNTLVQSTKLKFTIPKNTLLPDTKYQISAALTPSQGRSVIQDSILITTVATQVPVVAATVILPKYNARRILSTDVLNIFADVQAGTYSSYKNLTFTWNSVSGTQQISGSPVKLSTITMNNSRKVTQYKDQLIIRANTLLPGNIYRFQVVVTDPNGGTGIGNIDVTVAKVPVVGSVISNPTSGSALSDTFEITASQWTVDPSSDMPLSYQFDIYTSNVTSGVPTFSFPYQTSPKIKTFLPTPTGADNNIYIVVTGKSTFGASSTKILTVQVNKVVRSVADMKNVFTNAANDALERADTGAYLRIATGVVSDLIDQLKQLKMSTKQRLRARADYTAEAETLNEILEGVIDNVIVPSPITAETLELHACTLQTLVSMPDIVNAYNAAEVLEMLHDRVKALQEAQDASPEFRITGRTKQCITDSIGSVSEIYAEYYPPSEEIRGDILETTTLTNALYMRDMACGAATQVFTAGSTTEYLSKTDLSSFTLSDGSNSSLVTFPDDIPVTGDSGSTINCFCLQETVHDAGLYSFVNKQVDGFGSVQLASTASNLRLRDCSNVPESVPLNSAEVLNVTGLAEPIELTLKLTPTSKTAFDAGKLDVHCVYYDKYSSTPKFSPDGITTVDAGGGEYICKTSHLTSILLVLSDKVDDTTSTTTTPTATSTATSTSTDTSDSSGGGLSGGAIAGIAIGACAGAALAGGAAYYFLKKK